MKTKKGFHVRRCRVFTENIGEDLKKVFVVRDEAPHFFLGPRLQPAWPRCESGSVSSIRVWTFYLAVNPISNFPL